MLRFDSFDKAPVLPSLRFQFPREMMFNIGQGPSLPSSSVMGSFSNNKNTNVLLPADKTTTNSQQTTRLTEERTKKKSAGISQCP